MTTYDTKALNAKTWPHFARLVDANNGVWGGCWCMWYHGKDEGSDDDSPASKTRGEGVPRSGRTGACLAGLSW